MQVMQPYYSHQLIQGCKMVKQVTKVDGRKLWLDECFMLATESLSKTYGIERKGRELTPHERQMKHLAASYLYLFNVVQEKELLRDTENLFEEETLH